jgi:thioesterase domain-containing protein
VAFGLYCAYKQRPYSGRIHVFRVEQQTTLDGLAVRNSLAYWLSLAKGGIEAYTVAGDHDTMFVEPHVTEFAKIMCRCLAEAQRRQQGKT